MVNLKEALLSLPTVTKVEVIKGQFDHGVPCTDYKIWTRHPKTKKLYYHIIRLASSAAKGINSEKELLRVFKSYLDNWWTQLNLEDKNG